VQLGVIPLSLKVNEVGVAKNITRCITTLRGTTRMVACGTDGSVFVADYKTKEIGESVQFESPITGLRLFMCI
jgi:hypothetical protein